jgi:molybdopterin-containing oxidoreductase family iron-sulfur binding subunit
VGQTREEFVREAAAAAQGRLTGKTGRVFWRSVDELAQTREFREALEAEFASVFADLSDVGRRSVLKAMGASLAMMGIAGCSAHGDKRALPYVDAPEFASADKPKLYATAVTMAGYAQPVLGTTHAGRPTKLEGLPEHPASHGATDAFTQAALLGLYDPDRSQSPRFQGRPAAWAAFDQAMVENAARLNARQGKGLRLLIGAHTSPTLARQLTEFGRRFPQARWHVFEPVDDGPRLEAARLAFGNPLERQLRLDQAEVVVSLDDDLLGPGPHQTRHAGLWATRRRAFQRGEGDSALWVAEPTPSLTGVMAGDRLISPHARIGALTQAVAAALGENVAAPSLGAREQQWVQAAAGALSDARGRGLLSVGAHHDSEVQALALVVNARLGNIGSTMTFTEPLLLFPPDGSDSFSALMRDAHAGEVDTLAIFDGNPVFAASPDFRVGEALARVRLRIHTGLHYDETAAQCHWHAPIQHALESWSDARSIDGLVTIGQPLVRPFYDVRSHNGLLETLQGRLDSSDYDLVAATWRAAWGDRFDERWRQALYRGFVDASAPPPIVPTPREVTPLSAALAAPSKGVTVLFRPDPCIWDGRFANNPWLQELPKPLNKVTWDNVVAVSPGLAKQHGLANGDVVRLSLDGRAIEGPVWVTPGQERATVTVFLGYGRQIADQVGDGHGYDAYRLRSAASPWALTGVQLVRTGASRTLASTQLHSALQGFDFVRTVGSEMARAEREGPSAASQEPSLYPDYAYDSPSWGMSIDTDVCIGCNACVTACDAENNVPMVGREQVAMGREMHWLRIDHYHEGDPDDPKIYFQPVPCMHCEKAPCEMGCPVNATVHAPDGLNLQIYNRCIGTRTCSSFCPYKVRHFNWFDYTGKDAPELQAARNPNVTVRSRGVMEKCTYCIQRISDARITAKLEGRPIADGEVKTACQQACPTEAIVFGNIKDPKSAVSGRKRSARDYTLLEEVNTRPRTTYLARIEDPTTRRGGKG